MAPLQLSRHRRRRPARRDRGAALGLRRLGRLGRLDAGSRRDDDAAAAPTRPAPHWKAWLCKPGQKVDWCNANLDVTVVSADGSRRIVRAPANPKQPIDCFFVYPTVSMDRRGNSDLEPGQGGEAGRDRRASRFRQACRVFAPLYRQRTAYSRDLNG